MKNLWVLLISSVTLHTAYAQTFEGNLNRYETPLGMNSVQDIDLPAQRVRDENFNRTIVNSNSPGFAITAIGNLINVTTSGNNNTVQVNATQTNTGNQSINLGEIQADSKQ